MEKKLIIILSLFYGIIFSQPLSAQIEKAKLASAYIYNFAKHTTWPNEKEFHNFNLCILSENQELIDILKLMAKTEKIRGKAFSIWAVNKLDSSIHKAQIIYVAEDKKEYYLKVYDITEYKPIMLIGENIENKLLVAFNLYDTKKGNLLFEINKGNIYKQDLKVSDDILIKGGTEIDVIELYLQSKNTLREMDKKMTENQKSLYELNKKINESQQKVNDQNILIEEQNNKLEKHLDERKNLLIEIDSLYAYMNKQKRILQLEQSALIFFKDSLNKSKALLEGQNQEILARQKILNQQKLDIDIMNKTLSTKDEILGEQNKTIIRQKLTVYLFGAIILLVVVLAYVMYRANKDKKKKNALLSLQKEELNESYEEIKTINEQINAKNKELNVAMAKLKIAQQQMVQSEKMASLGVLTAGIAHEINNPINFIFTGINSLKKDLDDLLIILNEVNKLKPGTENLDKKLEEIILLEKEYCFDEAYEAIPQTIKDISTGIERTVEIIDGLQYFSRMGNEPFKLNDIHHSIDNALLLLKNKYKHRISIINHYGQNLPQINCNSGKLIQAFMNIISNSIDAIEGNGEIEITTKHENNNLEISIKDNGTGMDKSVREKIFDPFFTTKEVGKGTGLGMAITYGIIKEHNGEISVKSEIGKGTEFIITFPVIN